MRKNLRVWVGLGLAAVLLVATVVLVEQDGEARARQQGAALASAARNLELQFFERHRPELEWLALQEPVRHFLAGEAGPGLEPLLQQTAGLLDLEVVFLVSSSGKVGAATNPDFLGVDVSMRDYFRRGMSGLPAYAVIDGRLTHTHGVYASVPVYSDGAVVGVAAFRSSSYALDQWQRGSGALLVDSSGFLFLSNDPRFPEGYRWVAPPGFHASLFALTVVPGFSVVSVQPLVWPWGSILITNLTLLLLFVIGLLAWTRRRLSTMRRREQLLSHLLEGIAVFDGQTSLLWANPAFERLVPRKPGEPLQLLDLWDSTGPRPWIEVLEGRRASVVFEAALRAGPGGWVPVTAGLSAAEGQYVLSVLDGSERYRSDQLLRQSQKLTALGQLSGGIAHDLNNMLGVLMGMADLLKISLSPKDPLQDSVDLILSTLTRAAGLSEKMLNFARQTPMKRLRFDLAALLRELRFLAQTALPAGTLVEVEVPETELAVEGDENLLLSAFLNLILNAGEALPDGGRVIVTCTLERPRVVVAVSDEGIGMDKTTLARIFEPFFSTKLDKKGTGLGLSLVRRTVLEHRGSLDVQSTLGKGTRVAVSLPLLS